MTAKQYERMLSWFRRQPLLAKTVVGVAKGLPVLFMVGYIGLCTWLYWFRDGRLWRVLAVPAVTLGVTLALRRLINRPRPYEVYRFSPLISREKPGQSCPSNHAVSAMIIALTALYLSPTVGLLALLAALLVAVSRVAVGVHWLGDIIVSVVIAVLIGFLGFWIF